MPHLAQAAEPVAGALHPTRALPTLPSTIAGFDTAQRCVTCASAVSQQCLQTLMFSILFKFVPERSLQTHFFLLFRTISPPSPLTYV